MKEDEMMTSAGSAEDRNVRRKHSGICEVQFSDDTERTEKEINNDQKKKWKVYCRNFQRIR